jgi:hypothetical protein
MKKLIFVSSFIAMLAIACNSEKKNASADSTATTSVDSASKPVDTAAMNKAWAAHMTPGAVHKMLATADGKWNAEITIYLNPDSPSVSKAVCENKMILGGRYQQSVYTGNFEGMPFEGIGTLAYDNSRKVYLSTWIDNMGTGLMYMEGNYDEGTKTMTLKGKGVDVVSGQDIQMRETFKMIDNNTQQMEMFDMKEGKEAKTMSIKLTRAI